MRINSLYRSAIGWVFLILFSIWANYQFVISNTAGGRLNLRNAKARTTSSSNLTLFLSAARISEISESQIDFVRNKEIADSIWPSWENGTIQIEPMLDFVNRLLVDPNQTFTETRSRDSIQMTMFAETPYVVSRSGVQYSQTLKKRNVGGQQKTQNVARRRLDERGAPGPLSYSPKERKKRWPRLNALLIQKDRSFPFLVFFGDHNSCDYQNYQDEHNETHSLPLFTFGTKSQHDGLLEWISIASYKMIRDSKRKPQDWDREFRERDRPAWRGSLSDVNVAVNGETPRSKLVTLANNDFNETSLFDVGFSGTNHFNFSNVSVLTHPVKDSIRPFVELQQFVAVIDADGNAWSSRFPTQLCLNSVSLKVEPHFSDYFIGTQVVAGVHYVPIKADLSDLLEKTLWVMLHPKESRQIVANARKWCREHMIWTSLAKDLLNSWEKYITWMNEDDPNWYETWEKQWEEWNRRGAAFKPIKNKQKLSEKSLAEIFQAREHF